MISHPRFRLFAGVLALVSAGCANIQVPPSSLERPGWVVQETAAIWRPPTAATELAGELLSARHTDGSLFVQFSKQGLPLVTARTTTNYWEISSAMRSQRHTGRLRHGGPPDQVPWFYCATVPPVAPKNSRWQVTSKPDGIWRITNPRTGEFVEGVP